MVCVDEAANYLQVWPNLVCNKNFVIIDGNRQADTGLAHLDMN